ncbi:membrane protein YqaA, SNARE-associated domain [Granulicella pectinivorans]|uniref:Membrane protein YqaA, SNARE-associated domain n=1 Tax=Granulicella pectinivorans TaxID=474950 RepID=A0A1I6LDR2_9BACT|nr:VTT domain-containing protein [Granulicella pectinivorans]SFS01593.1 membrane protein YqaA, SNARE-associated domain [Granulicella pectinivorans]
MPWTCSPGVPTTPQKGKIKGNTVILSTLLSPASLYHKFSIGLFALLAPLGIWGVFFLSIIDSTSIPMPADPLIIHYAIERPHTFYIYCFMAALGSAIGALVPYYIGRAGGELVLLKRINRERFEKLRDRFEKQEFLAIMIPAVMPPPMPVKLFELAAGVFEMRPLIYFLAILTGKFIRFLVWGLLVVFFGQTILHTVGHAIRQHAGVAISGALFLVLLLAIYVVRRIFDKRRGTTLPIEENVSRAPTEFVPPAE